MERIIGYRSKGGIGFNCQKVCNFSPQFPQIKGYRSKGSIDFKYGNDFALLHRLTILWSNDRKKHRFSHRTKFIAKRIFVQYGVKLRVCYQIWLKFAHNKAVDLPSRPRVCGAPWARAANFVKKPPFIFNTTNLELDGFNASICASLEVYQTPKSHNALINVFKFITYV